MPIESSYFLGEGGSGEGGVANVTNLTQLLATIAMAEGSGTTGSSATTYTRTINDDGTAAGLVAYDDATDYRRIITPVMPPLNFNGLRFIWRTDPDDGTDPEVLDVADMSWGPTNVEGDHSTRSQVARLYSAANASTSNSVMVFWEPAAGDSAANDRRDRLTIRKDAASAAFPKSIVEVYGIGSFGAEDGATVRIAHKFTQALLNKLTRLDVSEIRTPTLAAGFLTINYRDGAGDDHTAIADLNPLAGDGYAASFVMWRRSTNELTATPTGGSYVKSTRTFTPPANWSLDVPDASAGARLYMSIARVSVPVTGAATRAYTAPVQLNAGSGASLTAANLLTVLDASTVTEPTVAAVAADNEDFFIPMVDDTGANLALRRLTISRLASQEIMYEAVKAMLEHNSSVSVDDANQELDISGTGGGADGDDGISIRLQFRRSNQVLSARPTGGSWNHTTRAFVPATGWAVDPPNTAGRLWGSIAVLSGTGNQIISHTLPFRMDGATGAAGAAGTPGGAGDSIRLVFRRSTVTLSANPTGGSWNYQTRVLVAPTNWSLTPPNTQGKLWASVLVLSGTANTIKSRTAPFQIEGADGSGGSVTATTLSGLLDDAIDLGGDLTVATANTVARRANSTVPVALKNTPNGNTVLRKFTLDNLLSKELLYKGIKAILGHNDSVDPDDANNELDITGGGGGDGNTETTVNDRGPLWGKVAFAAGASGLRAAYTVSDLDTDNLTRRDPQTSSNTHKIQLETDYVRPANIDGLFFEIWNAAETEKLSDGTLQWGGSGITDDDDPEYLVSLGAGATEQVRVAWRGAGLTVAGQTRRADILEISKVNQTASFPAIVLHIYPKGIFGKSVGSVEVTSKGPLWATLDFASGVRLADGTDVTLTLTDAGTSGGFSDTSAEETNAYDKRIDIPDSLPDDAQGFELELWSSDGNTLYYRRTLDRGPDSNTGLAATVALPTRVGHDSNGVVVSVLLDDDVGEEDFLLFSKYRNAAASFPACQLRVYARGIYGNAVQIEAPEVPEKLLAIFWGLEQTKRTLDKRDVSDEIIGSVSAATVRLRWHASGPNEIIKGSNDDDILDIATAVPSDADRITGEQAATSSADNKIRPDHFIALAGGDDGRSFRVDAFIQTGATSDSLFHGWLYRVKSGTDSLILAKSEAYGGRNPSPPIGTIAEADAPAQDCNFPTTIVTVPANETHYLTTILTSLRANSGQGDKVGGYIIVEEL